MSTSSDKAQAERDAADRSWITAKERAYAQLLDLIQAYAYGPGEAGLACLEGAADAPAVVSVAEVRRYASKHGFELSVAVTSVREAGAKFERDGLE